MSLPHQDAPVINQEAADKALLNTFVTTLIFSGLYLFVFFVCKQWKKKFYHLNPNAPDDSKSPFHFFIKTVKYPATKVLAKIGYDAYVALEIMKLHTVLILLFCVYGLCVMLPINATGHNQFLPDNTTLVEETTIVNQTIDRAECVCSCFSNYTVSTFPVNGTAIISLSNIYNSPPDESKMYAVSVSVIWNTFWTWLLLYFCYRRFMRIRRPYRSETKPHNYAVHISGYDPKKYNEKTLKTYLEEIFGPGSIYSIHTVPAGPGVEKLFTLREKRMNLIKHIELFKAEQQKKDTEETRQNIRIARARLHKTEVRMADLLNETAPWKYTIGERWRFCKGSCRPCNYCCARRRGEGREDKDDKDVEYPSVPELTSKHNWDLDPKHTTNHTFVVFKSMKDARCCARAFLGTTPQFLSEPAPVPADVRWKNFELPRHYLLTKLLRLLGLAVIFLFVLLWFIPVAFACALTSLSSLAAMLPWLEPIINGLNDVPVIRGFVEGLFPQLIIMLFFIFLIPIIALIGDLFFFPISNTNLDLFVMRSYYTFRVLNVYLGGIIANTFMGIYSQAELIATDPFLAVTIIANSIPTQVNFFLNFVLANGLLAACIGLARLTGVAVYVILNWLADTPRDRHDLRKAPAAVYGALLANHNFIMLIVVTYSTIQPLILPIGLLYFACFYFLQKYFTLFHFKQSDESGGWYWSTTFSQMCLTLGVYHVVMIFIFIGVTHIFGIVVTAFMLALTILFWYYMDLDWKPIAFYSTLKDLTPNQPPDIDALSEDHSDVYIHPMLLPLEPEEYEWDEKTHGIRKRATVIPCQLEHQTESESAK